MKKIVCLFIFLFCYSANSQSLSVFNVDASAFPTIKANFYAFDAAGNQILNLSPSDFAIKENGLPRTVTNVSCPSPKPPKAISSVLVFDMSGSMHFGPPRIESAKKAANAWIDGLPLGKSECALVSFSDNSFIVHDFTTNMQLLKNSITQFVPTKGTNYNQALLDEPSGGLQVAQLGKHKRVVVFLTDGLPNFAPKTVEIIDFALKNQITIYAVTLDMSAPQCIKDLTQQTGGTYFENITTQKEAEDTYKKLLDIAQGCDPCEIEWQSKYGCQEGITDISINNKPLNVFTNFFYPLPNITSEKLEMTPSSITFKNVKPGFKKDAVVKVTARNAEYNISNIVCSNPAFTIKPSNFKLSNGQSKDLVISFTPTDSGYTYAKFSFESNLCTVNLFVSGGFIGKKPKAQTLKLLTPNGNEKFIAGNDTLITWEGVSDSNFVNLEYTYDNGVNWKSLADSTNGLKYIWRNIPKPESDFCRIRIKERKVTRQIGQPGTLQFSLSHKNYVYSAVWSPDDSRIATASADTTAVVWDAVTGKKLIVLKGHSKALRTVSWSPDASRVATMSEDQTVIIWDAVTGIKQNVLKAYNNHMDAMSWSPDGERLAISSDEGSTLIWDAATGKMLKMLITTLGSNSTVCWSPDGSKLASSQMGCSIIIWDTKSWAQLDTLHTNCGEFSWSPDGRRFVAHSGEYTKIWDTSSWEMYFQIKNTNNARWSPDGSRIFCDGLSIWDIENKKILVTLNSKYTARFSWSPNGNLVACDINDKMIYIFNSISGKLIYKLAGHKSEINDFNWSSDGSRIASASRDWSAKVWFADSIRYQVQEDQSDLLFSVVVPQAFGDNIDMKQCIYGSAKDSIISGNVRNVGSYPLTIDSMYITGNDAEAFQIVSGLPKFILNRNESKATELRFIPNRIGVHNATIHIITQIDTLVQNIQGEGVKPQIEVLSAFLDFGEVELGDEKIIQDTVLIKNISSDNLTIDNVVQLGPDKKQFEIVSGGNSFSLAPNESRKITIRFKPSYGGRTSGQLGFEYQGLGSPSIVQLYGIGKGGLVYFENDSGFAGDNRNLKLQLGNIKPDGIANIATNFDAVIRFQNSILSLKDRTNAVQKNDSVYLSISGTIGTSSEIALIPVIAGLGNAEETTIDIMDFNLKDNTGNKIDYNFEKQSGTFTTLGICQEGGARFFNPTGKVEILQIMPNPASEDIEINVNLIEDGTTILYIFNSNGSKVKEFNITGATGIQTIRLDGRDYSNGLYFIQLQTPTVVANQKLMIIK